MVRTAIIRTISQTCSSIGLSFTIFEKHSRAYEIIVIKEIHPLTSSSNTKTIYMISTSSITFHSSTMEDPRDLSRHHFRDDGEIVKTTTGFTPFHLSHGVESIFPIEC